MDDAWLEFYLNLNVQSTERHPKQHLTGIIEARCWDRYRIGDEMEYYYSTAAHVALLDKLPNVQLRDARALVKWQRAVKSEQELIYMRRAGRIVEEMHRRILDVAAPRIGKCVLVAKISDAALRGADRYGRDYPTIVPLAPSNADAGAPHLT